MHAMHLMHAWWVVYIEQGMSRLNRTSDTSGRGCKCRRAAWQGLPYGRRHRDLWRPRSIMMLHSLHACGGRPWQHPRPLCGTSCRYALVMCRLHLGRARCLHLASILRERQPALRSLRKRSRCKDHQAGQLFYGHHPSSHMHEEMAQGQLL